MDYSFDVVSKVDFQEVANALDQTSREIGTRYDFKDSKAGVSLEKEQLTVTAEDDYRLKSVIDILFKRLVNRGVPVNNLRYKPVEDALGGTKKQKIDIQQGIPQETAKEVVKNIKDAKFKVQASIQSDQLRVSSKSKDELQQVISFLKNKDFKISLQFVNYR